MDKRDIYDYLKERRIGFETTEHQAVYTLSLIHI